MYLPKISTIVTMRIDALKPSEHKKGRILLTLENGTVLRITEEEVLRFRLQVGQLLDDETLTAIQQSAKTSSTKVRAVHMIANRPLSKCELQKRLVQKGSDTEDAEAAVAWLEGMGVMDDVAYATTLVRHYSTRGYGVARIREELYRRGVPRELWDEALNQLPDSSETLDTLDTLIQKKKRGDLTDPKERKRICDALLRRGFSWSEVRTALGRYTEIPEE